MVLLQIRELRKVFRNGSHECVALDNVSFDIAPGQTLGLIGESGCGKSTLAKTILRLCEPTAGSIVFDGVDICSLTTKEMRAMRRKMQIIFQDPYGSLNPRMTVLDTIGEALDIHQLASGKRRKKRVQELLEMVGLNPDHVHRFPHQFSGGQRQRIGIARALSVEPQFIVCDEPTSALDVSIQAQIINLLQDLQRELKITYLFITHNLAVVSYIADHIAVMHRGQIIEMAESETILTRPSQEYTKTLLSAVPRI